jgi:flavin reductase (DIM6/NTAB) family NADH-FMN oxidoreductase RutF
MSEQTRDRSRSDHRSHYVSLPVDQPVWERFPLVAPLVLVATLEPDGSADVAPKHLAMPVSWQNWFGFVCHPDHGTYRNIIATEQFTVGYPSPRMMLQTSLAAAPRASDGSKPTVEVLPLTPARVVEGVLVEGCRLHLECRLDRIVDDLGGNVLVIGRVVAAHVEEHLLRSVDVDDHDLVHASPLVAYVHPGRVATVDETVSFPYHVGFRR